MRMPAGPPRNLYHRIYDDRKLVHVYISSAVFDKMCVLEINLGHMDRHIYTSSAEKSVCEDVEGCSQFIIT